MPMLPDPDRPTLLCVTPGYDASNTPALLRELDWPCRHVDDMVTAARVHGQQGALVGLLVLHDGASINEAAIEDCVHAAFGSEWIVLCPPARLDAAAFRALVLGSFMAHLPLPSSADALRPLLQQAAARVALRRRHDTRLQGTEGLGMVGQGAMLRRVRQQIRKVAATDAPVLIGGESGSGKELAARAIHRCSSRASGPFVAVNCGAISPTLIQSELFGHERGAFTGANAMRVGLIEAANGGSIFLDEIGDLPLEQQTMLLRFLQEKSITRVGGVRNLRVDGRVLAASHADLAELVAMGRFREDLYYRLNVLSIELAPLRHRMEDVPLLAEHFLRQSIAEHRSRVRGFTRQAVAAMLAHSWPGNVRELHNRVQRAVVMSEERLLGPEDLGLAVAEGPQGMGLECIRTAAERDAIRVTLNRERNNVTHTARVLGISRMTLYRLMQKHGIAPEGEAGAARGAGALVGLRGLDAQASEWPAVSPREAGAARGGFARGLDAAAGRLVN